LPSSKSISVLGQAPFSGRTRWYFGHHLTLFLVGGVHTQGVF